MKEVLIINLTFGKLRVNRTEYLVKPYCEVVWERLMLVADLDTDQERTHLLVIPSQYVSELHRYLSPTH